jgi:type III pantothenate kinase
MKMVLFEGEKQLHSQTFSSNQREELSQAIKITQGIERAVISNVGEAYRLEDTSYPVLHLNHSTPLPFTIEYSTPKTLGLDRIALVAGAYAQFPNRDVLILDAGTCITYDFLDNSGAYQGGGISPGMEMRLRALPHFTARLPKVEAEADFALIGDSTHNSILSGTVGGFKREVEATIAEYKKRYPSLITIVTGGDLKLFDYLLKNSIFAAPNILVMGLNYILEYNAEKL